MDTVFNATLLLLPILYTLLVMAYARIFTFGTAGVARLVRPLLLGTVLLHLGSIAVRSISIGSCPLGSRAEFLSLVAFSITLTYLFLELRIGERSTGVFALTPAFLLQLVAGVYILGTETYEPVKLGPLESFHTFFAIVGFSAVALCGVYALLYLFLYLAIKRGRFGLFYQKMPSLETLSDLNFVGTSIAFGALSLTLALGFTVYFGRGSEKVTPLGDPDVVLTVCLWLLYGVGIFARRFFSLGGKRLAYITMLGLVLLAGILAGGVFMKGFHA